MQESLVEEFRWVARRYVRMVFAPFVGAVRGAAQEFFKELKIYEDEFAERFRSDLRARKP